MADTELEGQASEPLYKDAMKEYGMRGTIIPAATSRAQSKSQEGAPSEDLGVRFDIHKPVAHNIVEYLPDGSQKVTRLDDNALARLQNQNKSVNGQKTKPIGYAEAVNGKLNGTVKAAEAQGHDAGNGSFVPVRPGFQGSMPVTPNHTALPSVANRKRTLVKFEGTFGRLSVPYDHVYQDTTRPDLLVMVQYNPDGNHFEAPESNDHIRVRIGEHEYLCLSGVQFSSEDRKTHYTVFAIDFATMEQMAGQEVGNGSQDVRG